VIDVLVVVLLATGCAKRPSMAQVSAPAPAGVAVTPATSGAPEPPRRAAGRPEGSARAPVTREAPREFVAVDALRDIHFEFDRYEIRPGAAKILDANAAWLKANGHHLVLIEGHCDDRGTNEYNLALGERRAKATMNYLVSRGIAADRIAVISYGEERPLCTDRDEACWLANRRAHFLVKRR